MRGVLLRHADLGVADVMLGTVGPGAPATPGAITPGVVEFAWPAATRARLGAVRRRLDPDGVLAGLG